jgi:hypothetical protein
MQNRERRKEEEERQASYMVDFAASLCVLSCAWKNWSQSIASPSVIPCNPLSLSSSLRHFCLWCFPLMAAHRSAAAAQKGPHRIKQRNPPPCAPAKPPTPPKDLLPMHTKYPKSSSTRITYNFAPLYLAHYTQITNAGSVLGCVLCAVCARFLCGGWYSNYDHKTSHFLKIISRKFWG